MPVPLAVFTVTVCPVSLIIQYSLVLSGTIRLATDAISPVVSVSLSIAALDSEEVPFASVSV